MCVDRRQIIVHCSLLLLNTTTAWTRWMVCSATGFRTQGTIATPSAPALSRSSRGSEAGGPLVRRSVEGKEGLTRRRRKERGRQRESAKSQRLALCLNAENEFFLQRDLTRCGLLRQRSDCWTLVQMTHVMTTSQSDTKVLTTLCRMAQEPSSGSGVKRSNLEAIRRADVEKAVKRAKMLEERRAARRASATPMDELEESATNTGIS